MVQHAPLIVNKKSAFPSQLGGGPSPPSGGTPAWGTPEPVELVEFAELAVAESSVELVEVEVALERVCRPSR